MNKYTFLTTALLASLTLPATATIYTIGGSAQQMDVGLVGYTPPNYVSLPGSNFTMFSPAPPAQIVLINPDSPAPYALSGTTEDVNGSFDDSMICFSTSCTQSAMQFGSSVNFSGSPWSAHDIRVFGPGVYTFETCLQPPSTACTPGNNTTGTLTVGPGQLGAHVLFDWSGNMDIDVLLLWEPNATFTIPLRNGGLIAADTRTYELASRDVDGDGNAGYAMTDGPFNGHNASFSLFLDQPVAIPAQPTMNITQAGNSGAASGIIDTSGGAATVIIDTGITPAANLAFNWNVSGDAIYPQSDPALITANTNGTSSATFEFDPTTIAFSPGTPLSLSVQVTNTDNGLSNGAVVNLSSCPAEAAAPGVDTDGDGIDDVTEACADSDNDGILEYLDPAFHTPQQISALLASGTIATVDAGSILIGDIAKGINNGSGIVISASDIGIVDTEYETSCVGGCFDFKVTGGALGGAGTTVTVVLPLSAPIPERAAYRKFKGGAWVPFTEDANNAVNSAASVAGVCPAPGDAAYNGTGLVVGNDCIELTLEDNGANDSNPATGALADPSGVAQAAAPVADAPLDVSGVGSLAWYILTALAGLIGFRRFR